MCIPAFYAHVRGVGVANYWHDDNECSIVQRIALFDRIPGHERRDRCPYCRLLDTPAPMTHRKEAALSKPNR